MEIILLINLVVAFTTLKLIKKFKNQENVIILMKLNELNSMIEADLEKFSNYEDSINYLRKLLDNITGDLMDLSLRRYVIVNHVGLVKKKYGKPVVVKSREEEMLKKIDELLDDKNKELKKITGKNFNNEIFKKFIKELINEAVKIQKK